MKTSKKSQLLVLFQFIGIAFIGLYENGIPTNYICTLIELSGLGLATWAYIIMKSENFRFTSEPKEFSQLITTAPYSIIRHPMYTSIIITATPMLIDYYTNMRLIIFIALILVLIIKVHHEEKILIKYFSEYLNYKKRTFKIIPFLY